MSLDEEIKLLESQMNNNDSNSGSENESDFDGDYDNEIVEDSDNEVVIEKDKDGNLLRMYTKAKGKYIYNNVVLFCYKL